MAKSDFATQEYKKKTHPAPNDLRSMHGMGFHRWVLCASAKKKRTRMTRMMQMVTDKSCKNNLYERRCCLGANFNSCVPVPSHRCHKLEACATMHPHASVADKKGRRIMPL